MMSAWHWLWIIPMTALVGMGGFLVHAIYWLTTVLTSPREILATTGREEQHMSWRFWFALASFSLAAVVLMSVYLQHVFIVAGIFWLPMASVAGVSALLHIDPYRPRLHLLLLAGCIAAIGTIGLINLLTGFEIPVIQYGLGIGSFGAFAIWFKENLKRRRHIDLRVGWPPLDQISYVVGGWIGFMAVNKLYFLAPLALSDALMILFQLLLALSFTVAAGMLSEQRGEENS